MLREKFFCFDKKDPVFVKRYDGQIKFCAIQVLTSTSAYVIYEWYLRSTDVAEVVIFS